MPAAPPGWPDNSEERRPGPSSMGWVGFVAGLLASGHRVAGRRALVAGAGGVDSAVAFALADAGVASLRVFDIDAERAAALAARLRASGEVAGVGAPAASGFDLIVNASPAGMHGTDPLPIDCSDLSADALVGDVVVLP